MVALFPHSTARTATPRQHSTAVWGTEPGAPADRARLSYGGEEGRGEAGAAQGQEDDHSRTGSGAMACMPGTAGCGRARYSTSQIVHPKQPLRELGRPEPCLPIHSYRSQTCSQCAFVLHATAFLAQSTVACIETRSSLVYGMHSPPRPPPPPPMRSRRCWWRWRAAACQCGCRAPG